MGKKRSSKTSKKKQAKAVKSTVIRKHLNATSTFGVPVTKGSSTATAAKRRSIALPKTFQSKPKLRRDRPNGKTPQKQWHAPHVDKGTKKKTNLDEEQRDFEREYASLRERQANKSRKNGPRQRRDMKFAPSDLRIDDTSRSTDELLTEATDRLASDSIALGGGFPQVPQQEPTVPTENLPKVNLLQSMASQIRLDERMRKMAEEKDRTSENQNNKYWALQEDDSEEENNIVDQSPKFQFTPASFSVSTPAQPCNGGTTYSNNASLVPEVGVDDPDL